MSSATERKPTDAGSLLTGRRRIPSGDAANAANPVNAQHLPDCSTADSPAPQALSTPFLPTLPRQATPDVLPQHPSALTPLLPLRLPPPRQTPSDVFPPQPASLTFCSIKNRHPFPNDDFSSTIFLTAIQNMIPTLTQTITFPFLLYSGFHPDISPKIPAYSLPAVEYFKTYSVSVLHPISQLP